MIERDDARFPGRRGRPLDAVLAFDRLEVGPVELTARRLRMPYAVFAGGERHATELLYRWEEDVFDPAEPASLDLASLIGAQPALNYGLFCREIVFRGLYDDADRHLLARMAENTAREIYVKKLLQPNPFLRGEAAALPPEARDAYLRAELVFPDAGRRKGAGSTGTGRAGRRSGGPSADRDAGGPSADRARHAVLSSGGKDSLLSLGLLREAGVETHAVFVNESGRHWYSALNAYRHLAATHPRTTARVWMTSDRLFAWMLRRLPFVRRDFARVRADEYPIRLWTVAVFLFGALPVLRKRGIARIAIGDEYDTTRRARHARIVHHDGLYDQSRWFDEALSRYYARKGWPLVQFSLLRPASELLVQKTLARRYPELQRHQVSCHAASIRGDRVHPCGRCEKCRRIVGMLVALDADPAACGYGEEEVAACLRALSSRGVHQEEAGTEHLAWMLAERGLVPPSTPGFRRARERPEVMKLRFHEENAPPDAIPVDLRRPVWEALLAHADGALLRRGRRWEPFDPLAPEVLARPYRFEGPAGGSGGRGGGQGAGARSVRGPGRLEASTFNREGGPMTRTRLPLGVHAVTALAVLLLAGCQPAGEADGRGGGPAAETGAPQEAARAPGPTVEYLTSDATRAAGLPFSDAVRVGDLLFLSGQIGTVPGEMATEPGQPRLAEGGIAPETRQTMENIQAVLERHGSSLDRVVKCTAMLADIDEWPAMNEVYVTFFEEGRRPARSAFGTGGLALGARVEIECIATVG